jgi:hypothetical protein
MWNTFLGLFFLYDNLGGSSTLTWPTSDREASAIYLSDLWASHDQNGEPRIFPSMELWNERSEVFPRSIPSSQFSRLPIGYSDYSVVYAIGESSAIKYHSHCPDETEPYDTTLSEAYFLTLINSIMPEITHQFLYLSNGVYPTAPSQFKTAKIGNECGDRHQAPLVRYMITERTGRSISQRMGRRAFSFRDSIEYGISMLKLVSKLHVMGLAHGDVHLGNFVFRHPTGEETPENLILIDFGRARVVSTEDIDALSPFDSDHIDVGHARCQALYTLWEILSDGPPSFRDDAYRVLLAMGIMMYSGDHVWALQRLCEMSLQGRADYIRIHLLGNLFDIEYTGGRFALGDVIDYPQYDWDAYMAMIRSVRKDFAEVLRIVRQTRQQDLPEYGAIIEKLENVMRLTDPEGERNSVGSLHV